MNTWTDFVYIVDSWWCSADWDDDSSAEHSAQLSTQLHFLALFINRVSTEVPQLFPFSTLQKCQVILILVF